MDTFKTLEVFKIQSLEVKVPRWRSENTGEISVWNNNCKDGEAGEFLVVCLAPGWLPASPPFPVCSPEFHQDFLTA